MSVHPDVAIRKVNANVFTGPILSEENPAANFEKIFPIIAAEIIVAPISAPTPRFSPIPEICDVNPMTKTLRNVIPTRQ